MSFLRATTHLGAIPHRGHTSLWGETLPMTLPITRSTRETSSKRGEETMGKRFMSLRGGVMREGMGERITSIGGGGMRERRERRERRESLRGGERFFSQGEVGWGGGETLGVMFPGQGCQYVGMTKDLYHEYPAAKKCLDEFNVSIGSRDLLDLMFNGPREDLSQTEFAQPCIMAHSLAVIHILREHYGIDLLPLPTTNTNNTTNKEAKGEEGEEEETIPFLTGQKRCKRVLLGHSLGEYSALTAAGVFRESDAAKIVHQRGKTMQQAAVGYYPQEEGEGGEGEPPHPLSPSMISLMPTKFEVIVKIIEEMNIQLPEVCEVAAVNSPNQLVISGTRGAVQRVADEAKRRKEVRRIRQLDVSAPFHCQLMAPAASAVARILRRIQLQKPAYPIISNVTAKPVSHVDDLIELLEKQTISTVHWMDMVKYAHYEMGVNVWIEVGPGSVLSSLVKSILPPKENHVFNLCSYEDIHHFSQMMSKGN